MNYSPPGSSGHGIFQARILEWVAISFSKGPSSPVGSGNSQTETLSADMPIPSPYYSTERFRSLLHSIPPYPLPNCVPNTHTHTHSLLPQTWWLNTEIGKLTSAFSSVLLGRKWKKSIFLYIFLESFPVQLLTLFTSSSPSEPPSSLHLRRSGQTHLIQLIVIPGNKCHHTRLKRHGVVAFFPTEIETPDLW